MVLVENINTKIVSIIGVLERKGIELTGYDGRIILGHKKGAKKVVVDGIEKEIDIGWVGESEVINPDILHIVLESGYIPVISPIAVDAQGNVYGGEVGPIQGLTKFIPRLRR
jgi:acetylglutamate kinase